jgi:hypothetical protein
MHILKLILLLVNLFGGVAVIGSYILGFKKQSAEALWGGVPQHWIPYYTAGMVLAAIGYFMFMYYLLRTEVSGNYWVFIPILAVILIASTFWMPLTVKMIAKPAEILWLAIRLVLAIVALASLALIIALGTTKPTPIVALAGSILFFLHVAVLDAILWVNFFKK